MKKDKKHFWKVVYVAMALPIVFAVLDLMGARMWRSLGGWAGEAYVAAQGPYMLLFWSFAYLMVAAIAITYYFARRDKSEALALGIIPYVLLQFGLEDVFFYFIGGHSFWDATMPWLTNNLWAPTLISRALGEPIITGPVLLLSAAIGVVLSYFIAKKLVNVKP
jgi:hypothetical protein